MTPVWQEMIPMVVITPLNDDAFSLPAIAAHKIPIELSSRIPDNENEARVTSLCTCFQVRGRSQKIHRERMCTLCILKFIVYADKPFYRGVRAEGIWKHAIHVYSCAHWGYKKIFHIPINLAISEASLPTTNCKAFETDSLNTWRQYTYVMGYEEWFQAYLCSQVNSS